jgi:ribokinase
VQFVAVGDVMVDVLCYRIPKDGERVHGTTVLRAGGSAVNAAFAAAEEGASAGLVGRIGSDAGGELVLAGLRARGVAPYLTHDAELATGVVVSLQDEGAVGVVADRGANAAFSPRDVPDPLEADTLLVSGFALFQSGSSDAGQAALDRFAGGWAGIDLASPRLAAQADLQLAADVLFATADEARAVTGAGPEDAARQLATSFEIVCVKLGADGALAVRGDRIERAAAEPVVRTTPFGAGDAFAAAFLVGLGRGDDLSNALGRACVAGARAAA